MELLKNHSILTSSAFTGNVYQTFENIHNAPAAVNIGNKVLTPAELRQIPWLDHDKTVMVFTYMNITNMKRYTLYNLNITILKY